MYTHKKTTPFISDLGNSKKFSRRRNVGRNTLRSANHGNERYISCEPLAAGRDHLYPVLDESYAAWLEILTVVHHTCDYIQIDKNPNLKLLVRSHFIQVELDRIISFCVCL